MPPSRNTPTEAELLALVARMARGEELALSRLYEATSAQVFGLALRILRERTAAEEVVVEVFAQAWRQAARFDASKGSALTWLCVMARTRAIDLMRARSRFLQHESVLDEDFDAADPAASPLERSAASEHSLRVRAALVRLPYEQRRLIEAAFFGGKSHSELAAELGQPLGTVKTRIRTGLLALERALAPLEGELAS